MENSESRIDFRCSGANSENVDIVCGKCCEKYMKQYNKFGFPVYGFVILNLVFIALVCAIYSQIMIRPKLDQLLDQETASSTGNKLLIAYSCQLSIRLVLGVIFIILKTQVPHPLNFPSKFDCNHSKLYFTWLSQLTSGKENLLDVHCPCGEWNSCLWHSGRNRLPFFTGIHWKEFHARLKLSKIPSNKSQPKPKIKVLKIRETHKENNYSRDPKTFRTPITFFRWSRRRHNS